MPAAGPGSILPAMVPVTPRFPDPGPPLGPALRLAGVAALLLALLAACEAGAWLLSAAVADAVPRDWLRADHMASSLLVDLSLLLHLFGVPLAFLVLGGPLRRALDRGFVALRRHRLLAFLARHRERLPAYFEGGETPELACRLARPGEAPAGDPGLGDFLLVLTLQAVILDLAGTLALAEYPVSGPVYATRAMLGLSLLGLVSPRFPVGRTRSRVLATLPALAIAALLAFEPRLWAWGPGLGLAALALPLAALLASETAGPAGPVSVLFATDRGVRVVEFKGERMREGELPAFRPERLTIHPGPDGPRWELWTSGLPPLEVLPGDGDAAELARTRALHGAPVRIVTEPPPPAGKGLLVTHPGPTLGLAGLLLGLTLTQWFPILQCGTALALAVAPAAEAERAGQAPPGVLIEACRAYLGAYPENESVRLLLVMALERAGDRPAARRELAHLEGLAARLPTGVEWAPLGPMGRTRLATLAASLER